MADKTHRKKRKPAQQRYTNEHRWEKNKEKKIAKNAKRENK
jgi:hypothetical protein